MVLIAEPIAETCPTTFLGVKTIGLITATASNDVEGVAVTIAVVFVFEVVCETKPASPDVIALAEKDALNKPNKDKANNDFFISNSYFLMCKEKLTTLLSHDCHRIHYKKIVFKVFPFVSTC
jgi:hypothetical protein